MRGLAPAASARHARAEAGISTAATENRGQSVDIDHRGSALGLFRLQLTEKLHSTVVKRGDGGSNSRAALQELTSPFDLHRGGVGRQGRILGEKITDKVLYRGLAPLERTVVVGNLAKK